MVKKTKVKPEPEIRHTTNDNDFNIFVNECRYWIDYYGIKSWHWNFHHETQEGCENGRASYAFLQVGRVVSIYLTTDWGDDIVNEIGVRLAAYHEVFEIMLARISTIATCRGFCDTDLEEAQHEIIRSFENTHFAERARSLGLGDGQVGEIVRSSGQKVCKTR